MTESLERRDKIDYINKMIKLVVGLTGPFNSGCTTTALYLERKRHFIYLSISGKFIIPELGATPVTRKNMQNHGDEKRKDNPVYFVNRCIDYLYENIENSGFNETNQADIVIECLRNHIEIQELHNVFQDKFFLIAISARKSVRNDRFKNGQDVITFKDDNEREQEDFLLYGQQMNRCIELADVFLTNDTMIPAFEGHFNRYLESTEPREQKELKEKLAGFQKFLGYLDRVIYLFLSERLKYLSKSPTTEPTPQEVFMDMAYSLSLFSECRKRKVGAILTIPKIISDTAPESEYLISGGFNQITFVDKFCEKYKFCYREYNKLKIINNFTKKCPFCDNPLEIKMKCRVCGEEQDINLQFKYDEDEIEISNNIKEINEKGICPNEASHSPHYEGEKSEVIIKCKNECENYTKSGPNGFKKKLFPFKDLYDCQAIHAEDNALTNAPRSLDDTKKLKLYTTTFPCLECTKKIVLSKVNTVIYMEPYPDGRAEEHFRAAHINLIQFEGFTSKQFHNMFKPHFL